MPVPLKNMILKKRIRFLTFKDEILSLEILIINKYRAFDYLASLFLFLPSKSFMRSTSCNFLLISYGDSTPKSLFARLFYFFWVLIGLVIIAIFNATMTASLTSISMTANSQFSGEEVCINSPYN